MLKTREILRLRHKLGLSLKEIGQACVDYDNFFYSVHYSYVNRPCSIRTTSKTIEVYVGHERVAAYPPEKKMGCASYLHKMLFPQTSNNVGARCIVPRVNKI